MQCQTPLDLVSVRFWVGNGNDVESSVDHLIWEEVQFWHSRHHFTQGQTFISLLKEVQPELGHRCCGPPCWILWEICKISSWHRCSDNIQ